MTVRPLLPLPLVLIAGLAGLPASGTASPPVGTDPVPATGVRGPAAAATPAGSASPLACEIPLRWTITEVDPRFGLSEDDAARAVRQAGMLWETAVGRVLMFQESSEGIPVRFVFDERQEMTLQRQEVEQQIAAMTAEIAAAQRELDRLTMEVERLRSVYDTRSMTYEERRESYQELVDYWNARGGAPDPELIRLRETEQELDDYRRNVNQTAEELNRLVDRVNAETDALNASITELNRARAELEERFPRMTVESAHYRDERRGLGRLVLSRDREIQVFQFEDRDHLLLVIAHELGHALGLEHSGVEGALMAESMVAAPGQGEPRVHPADVQQLRELCPEL